jgi:hypothetical protein
MGGRETGEFTLDTDNEEVSEGSLNFSLNMWREEIKPDAKGTMRAERVERWNETTVVLRVLDNPIPPVGEVGDGSRVKDRKFGLKMLLVASIKPFVRHVSKKKFAIHMNSRSAEGMMDQNAVVGTRGCPGEDGASMDVDKQSVCSINIALKVVPSGTLAKRRKGRTFSKKRRETQRVGETNTLSRIPGGIRSRGRHTRVDRKVRSGSSRSRRVGSNSSRVSGSRQDIVRGLTQGNSKGRESSRSSGDGKGLTTKVAKVGMKSNKAGEWSDTRSMGGITMKNSRRSERDRRREAHGTTKLGRDRGTIRQYTRGRRRRIRRPNSSRTRKRGQARKETGQGSGEGINQLGREGIGGGRDLRSEVGITDSGGSRG